jgi:hypothetical protein
MPPVGVTAEPAETADVDAAGLMKAFASSMQANLTKPPRT